MFGYFVAWVLYLASVLGLWWVYRAGIARLLPEQWQPVLPVLLGSILLTPWPIDADTWWPAPAIIAVIFNALSGFGIAALKSLLPILLVTTLTCFVAWFISRKSSINR